MPFGLPCDSGELADVLRQRGSLEAQIRQMQASVSDCDPAWLSSFIIYSQWAEDGEWLTSPWALGGRKCQECHMTLIMWHKELQIALVGVSRGTVLSQQIKRCSEDKELVHKVKESQKPIRGPPASQRPRILHLPLKVLNQWKSRVLSWQKVGFLVQEECKPSYTTLHFCCDKAPRL